MKTLLKAVGQNINSTIDIMHLTLTQGILITAYVCFWQGRWIMGGVFLVLANLSVACLAFRFPGRATKRTSQHDDGTQTEPH